MTPPDPKLVPKGYVKDGLMFVGVARSTTWRCGRWKALLVRILGKNMGTGMWRYRGVFYLLKECK